MKILVISDIHGLISYAERMIEAEQPDEVIFCGDGLRDIKESAKFYKNVRFHFVQGNCDFFDAPAEQFILLGGKNIFFTHGHRYYVKMEPGLQYVTLRSHAAQLGADIVLFGHTHRPDMVLMNGMIVLNPGAVAAGRYAIIEIEGEKVTPKLKCLD